MRTFRESAAIAAMQALLTNAEAPNPGISIRQRHALFDEVARDAKLMADKLAEAVQPRDEHLGED